MRSLRALLPLVAWPCFSQTSEPRILWHKADTNQIFLYGLSTDGRVLTYSESSERLNRFGVRDLGSGDTSVVSIRPDCYLKSAIPAPDASRFVYYCTAANGEEVVRVLSKDGSDRELFRTAADVRLYHTGSDGSQVLALLAFPSRSELVLINASDGSRSILVSDPTLGQGGRGGARLSNDGVLVAYRRRIVKPNAPESTGLFVQNRATKRDVRIDNDSPRDCSATGWTAEGTLVGVCDGKSGSEVRRWRFDKSGNATEESVRFLVEPATPLGVTPGGEFIFATIGRAANAYSVDLDPATVKATSLPRRLNSGHAGRSFFPQWFDGGKMISYVAISPFRLVIRPYPEGEERTPPIDLDSPSGSSWLPDGTVVLVGSKKETGDGYFRVNVTTGKSEPLLLRSEPLAGFPVFSPDGSVMYYRDDLRHVVLARSIGKSTEEVLYKPAGPPYPSIRSVEVSPDGKWLAFVLNRAPVHSLVVVPSSGGTARELFSSSGPGSVLDVQGHTWTHDSKRVLFVRNDGERRSLWSVPRDGGAPQSADLALEGLRHPTVHPGGRILAFAAGNMGTVRIQSLALKP